MTREELLAKAQYFVDCKYVARADDRQKSMGLAYVEAERQDLAREIVNFAMSCMGAPAQQTPEPCILCANGNDLPEGEQCAGCGREGHAVGLRAAVIKARGRAEPPSTPVHFAQQTSALQQIKDICAGDRVPNWKDDWQTTHSRGRILDICDVALSALASTECSTTGE